MPSLDALCATVLPSLVLLFQMSAERLPDSYNLKNIIYNTHPKIINQVQKGLNEFRPVALPSLVMKAFEKRRYDCLPLQFAYQARKGVADAKIFILLLKAFKSTSRNLSC